MIHTSKIDDFYLRHWLNYQVFKKKYDNKIVIKVFDHNKQPLGYVLDHSWELCINLSMVTRYPIYEDMDYMVQILHFYLKLNKLYPTIRKTFRSNPLTYIGINIVNTNINKITHTVNINMDDMLNHYKIFRIDGKLIAEGDYQY